MDITSIRRAMYDPYHATDVINMSTGVKKGLTATAHRLNVDLDRLLQVRNALPQPMQELYKPRNKNDPYNVITDQIAVVFSEILDAIEGIGRAEAEIQIFQTILGMHPELPAAEPPLHPVPVEPTPDDQWHPPHPPHPALVEPHPNEVVDPDKPIDPMPF